MNTLGREFLRYTEETVEVSESTSFIYIVVEVSERTYKISVIIHDVHITLNRQLLGLFPRANCKNKSGSRY